MKAATKVTLEIVTAIVGKYVEGECEKIMGIDEPTLEQMAVTRNKKARRSGLGKGLCAYLGSA